MFFLKRQEEVKKNQFSPTLLTTLIAFSIFFLTFFCSFFLGSFVVQMFPVSEEKCLNAFFWINFLASVLQIVILVPFFLYVTDRQIFFLSLRKIGQVALLFLLFFPLNAVVMQLLTYAMNHMFWIKTEPQSVLFFLQSARNIPFLIPILFIYIGFIAPLIEEILFRGFLFGWMNRFFGFSISAAFSSLIFSLAHINLKILLAQLPLFFGLFGISFMLCVLYSKFRSLLAPVLFHTLFNLTSLSLLFFT
jgi:membrane protease YdiL (CAAX protease family)